MDITLTKDIEKALNRQARKQGQTAEALALEVLRQRFVSPGQSETAIEEPGSLYDRLSPYIGTLSSSEHVAGGAQMSKKNGKEFATALLKKRQQGRL
jgi:hypothetical protein